jgi:hypothetical protein
MIGTHPARTGAATRIEEVPEPARHWSEWINAVRNVTVANLITK